MPNEAFRVIVIAGIILAIVARRANRLAGGVISTLVTTFILIFGLNAYSGSGRISIFGIPLSEGVFVMLIAVWYIVDVKQIMGGLKEGGALRQIRDGAAERLRSGQPVSDIMAQILPGLEHHSQELRQVGVDILQGKPFGRVLGDCQARSGKDESQAVLLYQQTVDVLNSLQLIVLAEAARLGIARTNDPKKFFLPSVKLTAGKTFSLTKKLLKGELIYSYNGKLVSTPEELAGESSRTSPESHVQMHSLFQDPRSRAWVSRKLDIKGGPLELKMDANG